MRGEELKGHLDLLLLTCVEARELHGYALIEELKRGSEGAFDLPEGTVYPALHRLERAGLLASRWSLATGRQRRMYRLTSKGRRALEERRRAWRAFSAGVDLVLGET
jgi:PadR family transcriptional regulator, regulatory protein PadR